MEKKKNTSSNMELKKNTSKIEDTNDNDFAKAATKSTKTRLVYTQSPLIRNGLIRND